MKRQALKAMRWTFGVGITLGVTITAIFVAIDNHQRRGNR